MTDYCVVCKQQLKKNTKTQVKLVYGDTSVCYRCRRVLDEFDWRLDTFQRFQDVILIFADTD